MLKLWERYEQFLLKWGLAAILIAVPLYPKFPIFNIPGTYVAIRLEDFLISLVSAIFLLYVLRQPSVFLGDRINQAFFLFFLVGLVSTLAGIFLTKTVIPHLGILHWARRIEYTIPFFIGVAVLRREGQVRFFIQILLIVAFLAFLYALGQIHLGFPVISTQSAEFAKGLALLWIPGARLHSTFAGHYDLAAFLVLVLPLSFGYFFVARSILGKVLVFIAGASSFWLLVLSSSRISMAAYLIGVGIVLWLLRRRLLLIPVFVISLFFIFTTSDLLARSQYTINVVSSKIMRQVPLFLWFEEKVKPKPARGAEFTVVAQRRISQSKPESGPTPLPEDRSTSIRLNIEWPRALNAFFKNPLLGTGYSSITLATDNDYLRMLGETGLAGALAFLLIFIRIFKTLINYLKSQAVLTGGRVMVVGMLGAGMGILVNAIFIDVFEASKVALIFWAISGIAVGTARLAEKNETV